MPVKVTSVDICNGGPFPSPALSRCGATETVYVKKSGEYLTSIYCRIAWMLMEIEIAEPWASETGGGRGVIYF